MTISPFGWANNSAPFISAANLEAMLAAAGTYTDTETARAIAAEALLTPNSGTFTSTTGAVTVVNIAHGLGATPVVALVQPANTATQALTQVPTMTVTSTNIVLTFGSALAASTSYSWNWFAEA